MKKTLEQKYQELIEHWEKLHKVNQLTEAEILGDVVALNNLIIKEIQKLMEKQSELDTRLDNIAVRFFRLEVRTGDEAKT